MKITRNGQTHDVRQSAVTIDGERIFAAYVLANQTWNGWSIPYFTAAEAQEWLAHAQRETPYAQPSYDAATDTFRIYEGGDTAEGIDPELWETAQGEEWTDEHGQTLHLYCIGGYSWIWDEVTPAERAQMFTEAIDKAINTQLVALFPEARTGDIDPPVQTALTLALENFIAVWVDLNVPTEAN